MTTKFRLIRNVGNHREGDVVYKGGDAVESNSDLAKIFPGKFRRIGPGGEGDEEEAAVAEDDIVLGVDVTDRFDANGKGLRVFKEGRHYYVAHESDLSLALNAAALGNKPSVISFIEDYETADDDDVE